MRFETFVALRYLRSKRKNRFVSLITLISVAGVSVGVIALIVVMSVMTGFDNALRDAIIGNRAHLVVQDPGFIPMFNHEDVMVQVAEIAPEMVAAAPFIQIESLMEARTGRLPGHITYSFVVGVDPDLEQHVTDLKENLTTNRGRDYGRGELPGRKEIVLGFLLADRLGVTIGDWVKVITPNPKMGLLGMQAGQGVALRVSGISQAQMADWDMGKSFVSLETARELSGRDGVDGIHLKLSDAFVTARVAERIRSQLGYYTETWYENQEAFFQALEQEKLAMFIILVFIILVAAFNITSTLIMIVMEKRRDIGILRTVGVSSRSVLTLFIIEGLLIGMSGTFFGVIVGTWLAYNLNPVVEVIARLIGLEGEIFNTQIYLFDKIPVAVEWQDVTWITISAVILTFLSTIYPAWSASRLDPVDALRYE
jgi:lipoprotein-releasing system permease protein